MNSVFDQIADGLAEEGFAVYDQFLSQVEVSDIIESDPFAAGIEQFRKAGIGSKGDLQVNDAIRGDYIYWIDKQTAPAAAKVYFDKLDQLVAHLNRSLYLSLKDYEVHMTIYPAGSYYKRHLDQFKKNDHRKLSVICYLNHGWTQENGGQLRMYVGDSFKDFFPLAGRLVCFRSDKIEHEVLAANRERLSLTGWMLDQFTDMRHLS